MKNRTVVSQKQRLDALFKVAGTLDEPELLSHYSRYLCVLVSGFIESSVRSLFADYARVRSSTEVACFVSRRLNSFSNAKMEKILDLAGEFGPDLRQQLEKATEGELKDAIDSVVSNRHLIAHGQDVGIGFATIRQYWEQVIRAVEQIERLFPA